MGERRRLVMLAGNSTADDAESIFMLPAPFNGLHMLLMDGQFLPSLQGFAGIVCPCIDG